MNQRFKDDDGLYDLIDEIDDNARKTDTSRTEDLLFSTNPIDWGCPKIDQNEKKYSENGRNLQMTKSIDNAFLNVSVENKDNLVRSKLVNERAEVNMELYLPYNLRKDILISGFKKKNICCSECGENNTAGVDWCLFCGVLLIGVEQKTMITTIDNSEFNDFEDELSLEYTKVKSPRHLAKSVNFEDKILDKQVTKSMDIYEGNNELKNNINSWKAKNLDEFTVQKDKVLIDDNESIYTLDVNFSDDSVKNSRKILNASNFKLNSEKMFNPAKKRNDVSLSNNSIKSINNSKKTTCIERPILKAENKILMDRKSGDFELSKPFQSSKNYIKPLNGFIKSKNSLNEFKINDDKNAIYIVNDISNGLKDDFCVNDIKSINAITKWSSMPEEEVNLSHERKYVNYRCRDNNNEIKKLTNTENGKVKWRPISLKEVNASTIKLDLDGVETARSNGGGEWDFDIDDNSRDLNLGNESLDKSFIVPRLDLTDLNSWRDSCKIDNAKEEFKENKNKNDRKWNTSSTAWIDIPQYTLKKKPATYYRNKLNSCTNKIGITVVQSGIVDNDDKVQSFTPFNSIISSEIPNIIDINIKCEKHTSDISQMRFNEKKDILHTEDIIKIADHFNVNPHPDIHINKPLNGIISQWQCLPAEIWINIMMYLNHRQLSLLQQTCRRIYFIGLHTSLWRCINLYRHGTLNNEHIIYIARKKPHELHFKNCFGTNITVDGLNTMFKICGEGLKKISFISCSKGAFEDDLFLVLSASYCPNVTHINASYLMNLHDETLKTMIEGFTKIESLNIMGAHSISNKSIKSLIEHHCVSLINLDLYGCFKLNSATLTLLEECLNLRSLALGSISNLKRSALIGMLKKLSQLTILDLRGTMNLVDDSLLQQICHSCPNLQQIILTNSCRLTDDGLIGLAKSCVSKSLNILDICGCSKITEKGLEEVLKYCHELEDLDISCTGIKGDGAKYFKIYTPPKLRCLRINNNKFITREELLSLVSSCKKLGTLYMCGSTSIGSWRSIEEKFPHVTFKHE